MLVIKIAIVASLLVMTAPGGAVAAPGAAHAAQPLVTIAVVPEGTSPDDLGSLRGSAVGLLNPGLGDVPADQTWLDVSQGSRAFDSSYDTPLNELAISAEKAIPWEKVRQRARRASPDLRPGLLATTLAAAGLETVIATGTDGPALMGVNRAGRLTPLQAGCAPEICPRALEIRSTTLSGATELARSRQKGQLLIVIESPPAGSGDQLSLAIAGPGFNGMLTSESTRTVGYVLTTDLAPTILDYFGIDTPKVMTGLPISSSGSAIDYEALDKLEGRYQQVGKRRGAALLLPILIWALLAGAASALSRGRLARVAVEFLALSVILLPATLLLTASFSPSLGVERALATLLPAVVACGLLRLLPGFAPLAVACAVTVGPYAIDMLAGSVLTPKAVVGPNPGLGARFYGIGNELESTLMILTSAGVGAALTAWGGGLDRRRAAAAFLFAGLAGTVIFAAGRFGADVGAAIIFPVAAVIAATFVLERPRLAWFGVIAALVALVLVAAGDALLGGESHFLRSIFDGSPGDSTGQVLAHRLEETASSFTRLSRLPVTLVALALIWFAWVRRDRIEEWLKPAPALRAGLIAAAVGSAVGALSNDSGALFIQVGVLYLGLLIGYVWAAGGHLTDS
ncbi:MAG: hypothetical protein IPK93_06835 [Solirubrobacterales bacterium]|nr:hypothetical protein [Solirubrobacterales bacterium]